MPWTRDEIAAKAACEVPEGAVVNLGIGVPTLVAGHLPPGKAVWLQSENGLLGMGPFPYAGEEDPQLINAGKQTVTVLPGGATFDSVTSFAMIRGGHVDLAILGAMQVAMNGDLANWSIPGGKTMGIGGAMDLAAGARRIVVLTDHVTKKGKPKLVAECSFPLTAARVVDRVITDLAVLDCAGEGFRVVELAPGVSLEEVGAATAAPLT
ncbi:MAG: 3-oxoacid CoA-transferase subunit B [Myxococcota bacterium]